MADSAIEFKKQKETADGPRRLQFKKGKPRSGFKNQFYVQNGFLLFIEDVIYSFFIKKYVIEHKIGFYNLFTTSKALVILYLVDIVQKGQGDRQR